MARVVSYMGIDPSLTATGVAVLDQAGQLVEADTIEPGGRRGTDRLRYLRESVCVYLKEFRPTTVAVEGYSYGSRGRAIFSIAEWGGVLRLGLADWGYNRVDVTPGQLKKFASGRGNAGKPQLAVAIYRRWGIEFPDDNQADAYVLAQIARAVDKPGELTKFQAEIVRALGVAV